MSILKLAVLKRHHSWHCWFTQYKFAGLNNFIFLLHVSGSFLLLVGLFDPELEESKLEGKPPYAETWLLLCYGKYSLRSSMRAMTLWWRKTSHKHRGQNEAHYFAFFLSILRQGGRHRHKTALAKCPLVEFLTLKNYAPSGILIIKLNWIYTSLLLLTEC